MKNTFTNLNSYELEEINGGIAIEICGVLFTGWKAVAIISAGVTTLAGAAGLGVYNGYHSTKK